MASPELVQTDAISTITRRSTGLQTIHGSTQWRTVPGNGFSRRRRFETRELAVPDPAIAQLVADSTSSSPAWDRLAAIAKELNGQA
jgi:hypothetical protein